VKRALLHFFAIGAILVALDWWIAPTWQPPARPGLPFPNDPPASASAVASASARASSCPSEFPEKQSEAEAGPETEQVGPSCEAKLSTPAEPLDGAALDDELLYREALALGLDRDDPVVRRRLVQNMRFIAGEGGDERLYNDARALGMDRSDLVVRRRLIETMRLRLAQEARGAEPTDTELAAYLREHAESFASPPRVRLAQVFVSRRRKNPRRDADQLLARLRAGAVPPERAVELGDPLPVPGILPSKSEHELAKLFGAPFAARVIGASGAFSRIAAWEGPIASPYGLHLVWVYEAVPARRPALASVRSRVRAALLADREQRAVVEATRRLRRRYAISGDADPRPPS